MREGRCDRLWGMKEEAAIKRRFELVARELNERSRRLVAASEAVAIGWGGISAVSRATGLSRKAISHGIKELQERGEGSEGRIRRIGGGRKTTVSKEPSLREDLERLVEPLTRGDPESPLRWTCKSVRKLANELTLQGHQVSHQLVGEFKNAGREWRRQGEAEQVRVYDFPIAGLGRATPYGVYDVGQNAGWVNLGIDHDTAAFAVESIRRWWH